MDIKVFKKACILTFEFEHRDNTYGFLVNKTSGEFSPIEKFEYITSDKLVTENSNHTLTAIWIEN